MALTPGQTEQLRRMIESRRQVLQAELHEGTDRVREASFARAIACFAARREAPEPSTARRIVFMRSC